MRTFYGPSRFHPLNFRIAVWLFLLSHCASPAPSAPPTEASAALWSAHIQPILSQHCFKCHGELKQKNGLDLSSPGAILKGGDSGPALVPGDPAESLIFKFVQPGAEQHMPPKDYQLSEDELALLKMWIASMPQTGVGLVTSTNRPPEWKATDSPLVQPNDPKVLPPRRATAPAAIDYYVQLERKRLNAGKAVTVARAADDRTFARRIYLDLIGRIPTTTELDTFLKSRERTKRTALADRLLASPEHARHLRDVFDVVLMGNRSRDGSWNGYLEWAFQNNRPWDRIVRDVLLARPETKAERGAVRFLYDRKDNHQAIAEAVSPALLGLQVQCAQCHNHPLAPEIKQKHYWGLVSFFNRGKNLDTPEGPAISESAIGGFVKFANLKKESQEAVLAFFNDAVIPEARPGDNEKEMDTPEKYRLALEDGKKAGLGAVPRFSRREEFANLATRDNPLLARAFVNRIWEMFMGQGIVHPVDRMDSTHPPTHPDLLAWLARDFEQSSYDIRRLIRNLVLSRTYQMSSTPVGNGPKPPPETFACALEKPLSAEALWRSTLVATGHTPDASGNFPAQDSARVKFVDAFPDLFPVEFNASLKQALFLTNNPLYDELLQPRDGNLTARLRSLATPRERVFAAFETILGRAPDSAELMRATAYLANRAKHPDTASRELAWSLLTGAEFRLNH